MLSLSSYSQGLSIVHCVRQGSGASLVKPPILACENGAELPIPCWHKLLHALSVVTEDCQLNRPQITVKMVCVQKHSVPDSPGVLVHSEKPPVEPSNDGRQRHSQCPGYDVGTCVVLPTLMLPRVLFPVMHIHKSISVALHDWGVVVMLGDAVCCSSGSSSK